MSGPLIIVLLVILAGLGAWAIRVYNRLVRAVQLVQEAWSGIDVQLKRRHNLIPNLVETVKGYSDHERTTLVEVAAQRAEGTENRPAGERRDPENALTHSIRSIFALAEQYPDLRASESFLNLQEQLSEVEDQIQYARRYYNGAVRDLNILAHSFPSNLIATMASIKPREYFEIELVTQRDAPDITF